MTGPARTDGTGPTPLLVLDVVGLTPRLLDHMPHLKALARSGSHAPLGTVLPAVTCAAQSTFLTGTMPSEHGIVGNGWYFRELGDVLLWRQHNGLVSGDKLWDAARRAHPGYTVANICWWYAMGADTDITVTPVPSTMPTAARNPTATPARPACTTNSPRSSAPSRCSTSGDPAPTWSPAGGSSTPPGTSCAPAGPTWPCATSLTSTTTSSATAPTTPLPEGRRRPGRRDGPPPGRRPRRGPHRRRPVRVRHHPRPPHRGHQPGPAPRRPAGGPHPGRHGVPRPDGLPRLRGRRPPDRPRLRPPTRGPRRHPRRPGRAARHRATPRRRGQEGPPPRPSARRRTRRRRRTGRLVHVLLLARRRPRARLRTARRDPPQTRLRPGRAVHGPARPLRQGQGGHRPGPQEARHALPHGGRPSGRLARARQPRPPPRERRRRSAPHLLHPRAVGDRVAATDVKQLLLHLAGLD